MGATRWEADKRFVTIKHRMTRHMFSRPVVTWACWRENGEEPSEAVVRVTEPAPASTEQADPVARLLRAWLDGVQWSEEVVSPPDSVLLALAYAHENSADERAVEEGVRKQGGQVLQESRRFTKRLRWKHVSVPSQVAREEFHLLWKRRSFVVGEGEFRVWGWYPNSDCPVPGALSAVGVELVVVDHAQGRWEFSEL